MHRQHGWDEEPHATDGEHALSVVAAVIQKRARGQCAVLVYHSQRQHSASAPAEIRAVGITERQLLKSALQLLGEVRK